jgi:hypothetical protein
MAIFTKLSVIALLLASSEVKAIGTVEGEVLRQLHSRHHHNSELVYTFDKRGLYIKKNKHNHKRAR